MLGEIGPNPAALIELIWALARRRDLYARHVLVLHHQDAKSRSALHELRHVWSWLIQDCPDLQLNDDMLIYCPLSESIEDSTTEIEQARRWDYTLNAIERAKLIGPEVPFVYGLVGGRNRLSTAMSVVFFQMLARYHDLCFDVRVSHREVEGARARFYFPEQSVPLVGCDFYACDVEVILDELILPRFYNLLSSEERQSYTHALQGTMSWASLPKRSAKLNLHTCIFSLVDHQIKLTPAQAVYLALVVLAEEITPQGLPKDLKKLVKFCRGDDVAPKLTAIINGVYHSKQSLTCTSWMDYLSNPESSEVRGYHQAILTTRSKLSDKLNQTIKSREKLLVDDNGRVILGGILRGLSLQGLSEE